MPSASDTRRSQERGRPRHPEWRITPDELRCRVEDEGVLRVAARLAMRPETVRAAMRGQHRLTPTRVLALRDDVDLRPILAAFARARRRHPDA